MLAPAAFEHVVYTCVTGGYDDVSAPAEVDPSVNYVCFSDQPDRAIKGWEMRAVPIEWGGGAKANRYAKMHPHLLFPGHEKSVYVDGNIEVISGIRTLMDAALAHEPIALYEHPFRKSIFDEAEECVAIGFDWRWRIMSQMRRYEQAGFPEAFGLYECNVLFRRHHDNRVIQLMDFWWNEYSNGVKRDQLSFPYLAWRIGLGIQSLGSSDPRFGQRFFRMRPDHQKHMSVERNMRGWINRAMAFLLRSAKSS